MSNYIEIPIETDPEVLASEAFDLLQARFPGWVPNDGNIETVMVEANAKMTAEARDVVSAVPTDIFIYFGKLVNILYQAATPATSTTDWTMINNAGYTIPENTQLGIRTAGDVLVPFLTSQEVVVAPGSTLADDVPIYAAVPGADSSGLTGPVELIDTLDFVSSVVLNSITTGGQDAETDDEYINRLAQRLQLLAPRPILPRDFAIFAQDISGVDRAIGLDGYELLHNLLTANQSSLETDATGWENQTNATVARSTAQFSHGAASLSITATAAADALVRITPALSCSPLQVITGLASFRANTTGRTVSAILRFYSDTAGTTQTGSDIVGSGADTNAGFTVVTVSGSAPAGAVTMRLILKITAPGAGEVHYADKMALRRGTSTVWAIGGTPELNNVERSVAVVVADINGEPVSPTIKTEVDDYLQANREVTAVVTVLDPSYTTIDVNFTVKAKAGTTSADVEAATETAVAAYLSPKNWGIPDPGSGDVSSPEWVNEPVIRYLELAQVLNEVGTVDYVSALTLRKGTDAFASADITMSGIAPLPRPGVITGIVT